MTTKRVTIEFCYVLLGAGGKHAHRQTCDLKMNETLGTMTDPLAGLLRILCGSDKDMFDYIMKNAKMDITKRTLNEGGISDSICVFPSHSMLFKSPISVDEHKKMIRDFFCDPMATTFVIIPKHITCDDPRCGYVVYFHGIDECMFKPAFFEKPPRKIKMDSNNCSSCGRVFCDLHRDENMIRQCDHPNCPLSVGLVCTSCNSQAPPTIDKHRHVQLVIPDARQFTAPNPKRRLLRSSSSLSLSSSSSSSSSSSPTASELPLDPIPGMDDIHLNDEDNE
jgi:hypothetical protein